MSNTYVAVLLLSLMSCLTTALGVALALRLRENAKAVAFGIGFSAGIMVLISLFDLLPESHSAVGLAPTAAAALAGVGLIWSANLVIPHTHLIGEAGALEPRLARSVYLVVLGLILHDVPEGFAMANSYVASPSLGVLVAVAIALHNLPEEFAMAVPAVLLKSRRFLFGAAFLSAMAEPFGALVGLIAVDILPGLNPLFMAFAAGAMIFISFHELVPMARRYRHLRLFAAGLLLSLLVHSLLVMATIG